MINKFSGVPGAAAAVWRRMQVHALSGWPIALLFVVSTAGAVYALQAGFPPSSTRNALIVSFVLLVVWEVAVLRRMTTAKRYAPVRTELRYAASFLLYVIILLFGGVFILFPVIMATMALWALVSFDFESSEPTQEELSASFEAFQSHPLFALCVIVFVLGLAGFLTLFMRGRAYAAASVAEQRIVAMEAFNWTRTQGLFLLGVGFLVLLPFAALLVLVSTFLPAASSASASGLATASLLLAGSIWLLMLGVQALSVETYQRFRPQNSAPSND